MQPHWTQPSHPDILEVIHQPGSYMSLSRAKKSLPPGALVARLESPTLTLSGTAYSSVQVSRYHHVELNSDFLFINHSCDPSLEFHIIPQSAEGTTSSQANGNHSYAIEVRVTPRIDRQGNVIGLRAGEEMTFFYPSTEWDMAQPFDCRCGAETCKGTIKGAKHMPTEDLKGLFLNKHIKEMLKEQEAGLAS